MDKCERCDREGCIEACEPCDCSWPADYHCPECWDGGPLCKHEQPREEAYRDCGEHRVDWRKRALAAEADLAALRESARWIPVEDEVPDDCKDVLVWNGEPRQGWLDTDSGRFKDSDGGQIYNVTHWRPMPAPPEPQTVVEKTGRECPSCDNDEVFSDGDEQFEGELHRCEQCGKWAAISVTAGRYVLVDAPEPQAVPEVSP